ncbi:hypothetical protein [Mesorhizobium sp. M7A.F.Ca.CA.004.10.1.1]|uniref:hypothetical protein n=1 Tax=Mesorhizobium sp. M7A.F.Ca.CA.004.10.1.1 TaxID=2496697 RepID=UPI0013DFA556|nr:hypothetical protein [Mesorhizobium sp. M7A.F.Ca.CA.004.10.1.1]
MVVASQAQIFFVPPALYVMKLSTGTEPIVARFTEPPRMLMPVEVGRKFSRVWAENGLDFTRL